LIITNNKGKTDDPQKQDVNTSRCYYLKEFLEPMGLTQKKLADHLDIPVQRVNEIVKGRSGISSDTAWLLSGALNTSPEFWLNLQAMYDLSSHCPQRHIEPLRAARA